MWKGIIKDILEVKNYTQTRIAHEVGVSKEAISKLMRGVTHQPRFDTGSNLLSLHARLRPDLYQVDQSQQQSENGEFDWKRFLPESHPFFDKEAVTSQDSFVSETE